MPTLFLPKYINRSEVGKVLQYKKLSLVVSALGSAAAVSVSKMWLFPYVDSVLQSRGLSRPITLEFFVSTSYWVTALLIAFAVAVWWSRGEELSLEKRLSKLGSKGQILSAHLIGSTHGFKLYSIVGFTLVYLTLSLILPIVR